MHGSEQACTSTPYAAGAAYVDGEIVSIAEARMPITDWGFTRSDVTYDVVHVWKGSSSGLMIICIASRARVQRFALTQSCRTRQCTKLSLIVCALLVCVMPMWR